MRANRRWLAPAIYAAGIFVLSSIEHIPDIGQPEGSDKLAHFILYYFFAATIYWAVFPATTRAKAALVALAVAAAYGATDEFHQWFVPGRTMSFYDWLADAGGAAGWACVIVTLGMRRKPAKSR
jgi:VanZ family protein